MNKDNKIKYFIYARKSSESEDRQVQSIEDQVDELNKLAKNSDLNVVGVFRESKSAKAPDRPIFEEMLSKIRLGEANGILCWKLNRLARNPIDGGTISWMLQEGVVQHIQTYGRGYSPSDNVIMMSVEFGMANQFIRDLRVDTKRGLKAKAERGWSPTYQTLGYINNPIKAKGNKETIKDPERFDITRKMFDLMLAGNTTPPKILEIATNQWGLKNKKGKNVSRSTMYRILSDTFYYGEFEYPKGSGDWYKGEHEPMITREEYDKIQFLLRGDRKSTKPKKYDFAFRGPIKCGECNAMVTAEHKIKKQKNGNVHNYIFYHCTKRKDKNCSQKSIEEKKLSKQIEEVLNKIEIPESFNKWAISILKSQNEVEFVSRDKILDNQRKEYDEVLKKIDNLIDMRADGELTKQEFEERKNKVTQEKERMNKLMKDTDERVSDWIEKAEKYFSFAENVTERFNTGSMEVRKGILSALGSNLYLKDGELKVELEKTWNIMEEMSCEVKKINEMFEPQKDVENKRTLEDLYSQSPMLLHR
jgi:site-specific DNA recombinase